MPTGLTEKIYNGEDVSLRDFILKCATQVSGGYEASDYGAKDLPRYEAPVITADTTFYEERIIKAENELMYWVKLKEDLDFAQQEYDAEQEKHRQENEHYEKHCREIEQRYRAMLEKVNQWNASEPYRGIKEMMIRQLNECIEHDCKITSPLYCLKRQPVEEYIDDHIQWVREEINNYQKRIEEERQRVKEHNAWPKGLYEELDKVEPRDT